MGLLFCLSFFGSLIILVYTEYLGFFLVFHSAKVGIQERSHYLYSSPRRGKARSFYSYFEVFLFVLSLNNISMIFDYALGVQLCGIAFELNVGGEVVLE